MTRSKALTLCVLVMGLMLLGVAPAYAQQEGFIPIAPTKANKTITLTGQDMTIQDIVDIARYGAKVKIAKRHTKYMNRAYNLIIEASRQGIPVYRFNRGAGAARETVIFEGDPYEPANLLNLQTRRINAANGGRWRVFEPYRPYVEAEEVVRAMMAVRANNIMYVANGPATAQKITDLLNNRITPLTQGDGFYHGEGDLPQAGNVEAAIFGFGDVFYKGQRMPAIDALNQAGVEPGGVDPNDPENDMGLFRGIYSTNAYTLGQAALLVTDAKKVLDWYDLIFSVSMHGLNSSITPLSAVPMDLERPLPYAVWQAHRMLDILGDSYLYDLEFQVVNGQVQGIPRLLQDPDYGQRGGGPMAAPSRSCVLRVGYGTNVPREPAGAGRSLLPCPGTRSPGTPFTVSVEYANVRAANPIASALTAERVVDCCWRTCRRRRGSTGRTAHPRSRPRSRPARRSSAPRRR